MMHFGRFCPSVVVLYLLFAASTFSAIAAPEKNKVTMAIAGTSAQIYFLAVNVAKAHGYFQDEGLDVEILKTPGSGQHASDHRALRPDIYQRGPNSIRDKAHAHRAVTILLDHGHLVAATPGDVDGTFRRDVWRIEKG